MLRDTGADTNVSQADNF